MEITSKNSFDEKIISQLKPFYPLNDKSENNIVSELMTRILRASPNLSDAAFTLKKGNETVKARFFNDTLVLFQREGMQDSSEYFSTVPPETLTEKPLLQYRWISKRQESKLAETATALAVGIPSVLIISLLFAVATGRGPLLAMNLGALFRSE